MPDSCMSSQSYSFLFRICALLGSLNKMKLIPNLFTVPSAISSASYLLFVLMYKKFIFWTMFSLFANDTVRVIWTVCVFAICPGTFQIQCLPALYLDGPVLPAPVTSSSYYPFPYFAKCPPNFVSNLCPSFRSLIYLSIIPACNIFH